MAAFSSHQLQHNNPFLLDSVFLPTSPIKMSGFFEEPNNSCIVQQFYQQEFPSNLISHENSFCLDPKSSSSISLDMDASSVTDKIESGINNNKANVSPLDKKRKSSEGSSSMTSAHSKVIWNFPFLFCKLFIFLELGLMITLFFCFLFLLLEWETGW